MPASRSPQAASFASLSGVSELSHSTGCPSRLPYGDRHVSGCAWRETKNPSLLHPVETLSQGRMHETRVDWCFPRQRLDCGAVTVILSIRQPKKHECSQHQADHDG